MQTLPTPARVRLLLPSPPGTAAAAAALLGVLASFQGISCNTPGFDAVSISPIYGWVDGCNTVRVSGHGFAEDATVKLGSLDLAISLRGAGIDKGYWVESVLPPDPVTARGYADVTVDSDGKSSTIHDAYYYVECLQTGNLESIDTESVITGETVTLAGCSLETTLTVQLLSHDGLISAQAPLTSTCGTATVTFAAPELPDGDYDLQLIDSAGAVVFPPYECPVLDTADTAAASLWCPTLTYGGAK